MAKLVDLDYTSHDTPERPEGDSGGIVGVAVFCIKGDGDDYEEKSADFWDALEKFKEAVPGRQRMWDKDERLWTVHVTRSVQNALFNMFANAEGLFEDAERQLTFW